MNAFHSHIQQEEAIEAPGPDAHLVHKELHNRHRSDLFRSAIAFALALYRLFPEHNRRVTNETRLRNGPRVHVFTPGQLANPLAHEVR